MPWKEYYKMGRIEQLRNSGREFIGKHLFVTVKRDGKNVPIYRNPNTDFVGIGSHHKACAEGNIQAGVKLCLEYPKVVEMLEEFDHHVLYFEYMEGGKKLKKSPTRIEMPRKKYSLILIDIYDLHAEKYLSYNFCYQQAHRYRIPIVDLLDQVTPMNIDEVYDIKRKWLPWCSKHHREGVCIKDYYSDPQLFVKEKIDLPKRVNEPKEPKEDRPKLPPMPEEKIKTAIERAFHECRENGEDVKNNAHIMPRIARHVATEAREHMYSTPKNLYNRYIDYLEEEEHELSGN